MVEIPQQFQRQLADKCAEAVAEYINRKLQYRFSPHLIGIKLVSLDIVHKSVEAYILCDSLERNADSIPAIRDIVRNTITVQTQLNGYVPEGAAPMPVHLNMLYWDARLALKPGEASILSKMHHDVSVADVPVQLPLERRLST